MWTRVAETLFLAGIVAQGWGAYEAFGAAETALLVGTEMAAIGLIGVIRSAG